MSILVDSNVLIDIFQPGSEWGSRSEIALTSPQDTGPVPINQIVAAEVAAEFASLERYEAALGTMIIRREDVAWPAAFLAGTAHRTYRKSGGTRERTLPDFLIGAHAMVKGHTLLTRDARRYRAYFPALDIIAPDSHP